MRGCIRGVVCVALLACVTPGAVRGPDFGSGLFAAPPADSRPDALSIEPRVAVARLGETVTLVVRGRAAPDAPCRWASGAGAGRLSIASPAAPGVVDVECGEGTLRARAQVTFTDAATLHVDDPYAGGVVLFRLLRRPRGSGDPVGRQNLGAGSLDGLLERLGARAFPAFPFDRSGTRSSRALAHWVVIDIPEGVNFYQAVALLRADPNLEPESYLPEDGEFLRVRAQPDWPTPLVEAGRRDRGLVHMPRVRRNARQPGLGIGIAVVDTGVDLDHVTLTRRVRTKPYDEGARDADGNGLPGDHAGANFAQLAIAYDGGRARLALGTTQVSDWSGGHGTAIAALAAGAGGAGIEPGVAPGAWLLPVDVQENRRTDLSTGDPRTRAADEPGPLRASVWSRALGVAYAVSEGARIVTCAWPAQKAHWILRDVLAYAEDNCVLAVCSVEPAGAVRGGFPSQWRESWLRANGGGAGAVFDVWTGRRTEDFFARPLRNVLLAGRRPALQPDLLVGRKMTSARSSPENDGTHSADREVGVWDAPVVAVGITAGAAAVVTARRPDLDAHQIREALRAPGLAAGDPVPRLRLNDAVADAAGRPTGRCREPGRYRVFAESERPWYRRVAIKGRYERQPSGSQAPAAPDRNELPEEPESSPVKTPPRASDEP